MPDIDVTRHQNPNAQATLIMFMAIDIVKPAIAGTFQGLTSFVIAVIINLGLNAVKLI